MFASLGCVTLDLLGRLTQRASMLWTALAGTVAVVSLGPIMWADTTTGTRITLSVLHLTVAAVLILTLRGAGRERIHPKTS